MTHNPRSNRNRGCSCERIKKYDFTFAEMNPSDAEQKHKCDTKTIHRTRAKKKNKQKIKIPARWLTSGSAAGSWERLAARKPKQRREAALLCSSLFKRAMHEERAERHCRQEEEEEEERCWCCSRHLAERLLLALRARPLLEDVRITHYTCARH